MKEEPGSTAGPNWQNFLYARNSFAFQDDSSGFEKGDANGSGRLRRTETRPKAVARPIMSDSGKAVLDVG